jgi:hypothetical protein
VEKNSSADESSPATAGLRDSNHPGAYSEYFGPALAAANAEALGSIALGAVDADTARAMILAIHRPIR